MEPLLLIDSRMILCATKMSTLLMLLQAVIVSQHLLTGQTTSHSTRTSVFPQTTNLLTLDSVESTDSCETAKIESSSIARNMLLRALIPTNSDQFNLHSTKDSKGFRNQLNDFREALDANGVMAKMDFYAKPSHTPVITKKTLHWSPIPCYHYDFKLRSRLKLVRELVLDPNTNNRVMLMEDIKTRRKYVLKVYGNDRKYTAELGLGRLKGPYFVSPICTMDVRLPVKVGSRMDASGGEGDLSAPFKYVTRPAILMEYVEGVTADKYAISLGKEAGLENVEKQEKAFEKLQRILAQLFYAVTEIHASGLVYQDLKPDNLIVRPDGHLVMIDFDCMVDRAEPLRGSVTTTAPEQWDKLSGPLHNGVDFWGYGSTAAMLLANVVSGMYGDEDCNLRDIFRTFSAFELNLNVGELGIFNMNPLPAILSESIRYFLYPFFAPDPNARRFNTLELQQMIRDMTIFKTVDWSVIENPEIDSPYHNLTEEELRAHFLADTELSIHDSKEIHELRGPQLLYHKNDLMEIMDDDKTTDPYKPVTKPVLVAELVRRRPCSSQSSRRHTSKQAK